MNKRQIIILLRLFTIGVIFLVYNQEFSAKFRQPKPSLDNKEYTFIKSPIKISTNRELKYHFFWVK